MIDFGPGSEGKPCNEFMVHFECNDIITSVHRPTTQPDGLGVKCSLSVRKVQGSNPVQVDKNFISHLD